MRNFPEDVSEIHVLGPVKTPKDVAESILDQVRPGDVLLDLSAGQLMTPHTLKERVLSETAAPDGLHWINGQEYADTCGPSSCQEYVDWLAYQADEPLIGNNSIKELFTYKGEVSLWWFTSMAVKHSVNHSYRWLFYMRAVIRQIRSDVEAGEWHLWMDDEAEARAVEGLFPKHESVRTHLVQKQRASRLPSFWNRFRESLVGRLLRTLRLLIRNSLSLLKQASRASEDRIEKREEGNAEILVQTKFPDSWTTVDSKSQPDVETRYYDRYFGTSPWKLQDLGHEVAWMPSLTTREQEREWDTTRNRQTLPSVGNDIVLTYTEALRIIGAAWCWTATFLWYFEGWNIAEAWRYDEMPLGPWLYEEMWSMAVSTGMNVAQSIEQYRTIADRVHPDVVLYRDEFYKSGRMVAAALNDRTTLVGVQHGLIGREHTVYQIDRSNLSGRHEERKEEKSHFVSSLPVPDYFASFGHQSKLLFREWEGYPADRVWEVGGLRHDDILKQFGDLSRREIVEQRRSLGLPVKEPVVLLCTGLRSEVASWAEMTMRSIQAHSASPTLAIKLHQYHGGTEAAVAAGEKTGFSEYQIYDESIYPLMAVSDMVVGGGSTVILEAGLLGTPAITLSTSTRYKHYDVPDWVETVATQQQMTAALDVSLQKEVAPDDVVAHLRNAGGDEATARLSEQLQNVLGT